MSKGKEIIKGHTYYGTKEWVKLINEGRKSRKLSETETAVLNGEKVAAAIDVALIYERRRTLKECIAIVNEGGLVREEIAQRLAALLHQAEWPSKETQQQSQPEEPQPENPYMVKPPI